MSRPRSAPSRSAGAARGARPGVYVAAPKSDVFVALLGVSLAAIVVGALLFVLILSRYEFKTKVSANIPAGSGTASAVSAPLLTA